MRLIRTPVLCPYDDASKHTTKICSSQLRTKVQFFLLPHFIIFIPQNNMVTLIVQGPKQIQISDSTY